MEDVGRLIDEFGGSKALQDLTGLSKGRISQWRTENSIPRPWRLVLQAKRPDLFDDAGAVKTMPPVEDRAA